MALIIYYDGDCPLCERYTRMLRLAEAQTVELVDLRSAPDRRSELEGEGFDLDQGMVAEQDGRRYGGSDAVNLLALLSTPSGAFNRLNRTLLGSPLAARVIYPLLRMGRWLLLFLLGKPLMADTGTSARQTIFTICFALFSIFHFGNYSLSYGRSPGWDLLLVLGAAIFAFVRPQSTRVLFLLVLVSSISAWVQAPVNSNHTITRNFLLLGYWLSFGLAMIGNRPANAIFTGFGLAGQGVLLVMYFFGIFHKINTDFLNPITSCATTLWRLMPAPLSTLQGPAIDAATIYGTFIVEGSIALALLVPRWRHYGIAAGMAFHLLLAMSSYAMYISFTMLSIAMHTLFLSEGAARGVMESKPMQALRSRMRHPLYIVAALAVLMAIAALAFRGFYGLATMFALPLVLPYCLIILLYGRSDEKLMANRRPGVLAVGAITFAACFANGAMPYLGLKTAQSLNMYANLRLEQGASNHLVLRGAHRPFSYLDRVAMIEDGAGDAELERSKRLGFGVVYYDVLAFLADNPGKRLSFTLDGQRYDAVSAVDMRAEIDATLHPAWFRKWFHFELVQLERPEKCY